MKLLKITTVYLFGILLASCASTEKRIEANAELFSTFSSEDQALIREGEIAIGFTSQMVEISLGKPPYTIIRTTLDQEVTIWRYVQLSQYTTSRPVYVSGRYGGTEWVDVTNVQETEKLRVEFIYGKVISIEEKQP